MMNNGNAVSEYAATIRELSELIVSAQKPIRILDALKWDRSIKEYFFKHKSRQLPPINAEYYLKQNPLTFDPEQKKEEFYEIDRLIRRKLGQYSGVGSIMQRMCHEYVRVIEMLEARGTEKFTEISQELYGSSEDAFHVGAPTLKDLATLVSTALANIKDQVLTQDDEVKYTSAEVVKTLGERLSNYYADQENVRVELSDGIISDASAGADKIKVHDGLKFSYRDIRTFEHLLFLYP